MGELRVGVIGCGNMGGAIVKGLVADKLVNPENILVFDKDKERVTELAGSEKCLVSDITTITGETDLMVIAVKPQDSGALFSNIKITKTAPTVISVMAGVKISVISEMLGCDVAVARAMPNMAALVRQSVTAVSYNDLVANKEAVRTVLSGIGNVVEVSEEQLDIVTAVSGSGPAYLFYLAAAMIEAGIDGGLSAETSRKLVEETLKGASAVFCDTGRSAEDMIKAVASKGGTTEAALSVLDREGVKEAIVEAVGRARIRSEELSG